MTDQDDMEAYLHNFEVVAAREEWGHREWARLLALLLTGEPQRVYYPPPSRMPQTMTH